MPEEDDPAPTREGVFLHDALPSGDDALVQAGLIGIGPEALVAPEVEVAFNGEAARPAKDFQFGEADIAEFGVAEAEAEGHGVPGTGANRNLHIGRVIYGDQETSDRHRLTVAEAARITSRIGNAYPDAVKDIRPSRYLNVMARELLASQLIWNCLTAKSAGYADEREVRGVLLNSKENFDEWRQEDAGRIYVEHDLPLKAPGSVTEILVGPHARPGAEAELRGFLQAEGYPDVPIVRSVADI